MHPATTPASDLHEQLTSQHDVATRDQLARYRVTESTVRSQVDAQRWQSPNERVVVLHNGPLTRQQQLWVVVLSTDRPIALCSLTALEEAGLVGFETEQVHAVVERGVKLLPVPGVPLVLHESRRFTAADIAPGSGPPRTGVERSTIDAAAWSRDPVTAARLLTAAVQQRLTVAPRLTAALETAGKVRFHRLMAMFLVDIGGGAHALSELEFFRFCRRNGFPRPESCQVRRDSEGRRRYLDARFRRRDGSKVLVEVDGGVHLTLLTRWKDTAKDNDDVLDRRPVLRFVSVALYTDDPVAIGQLRRALRG